jgi:hypothetical protein
VSARRAADRSVFWSPWQLQIHIHRVRGGKIIGHAATRNDLLMLSQLGLLPGIKPVSETAWRIQLTPDAGPPA